MISPPLSRAHAIRASRLRAEQLIPRGNWWAGVSSAAATSPGSAEVRDLTEGHRDRVRRSAILSGLHQFSLWLGPLHGTDPIDFGPRRAQFPDLPEHKAPAGPRGGR